MNETAPLGRELPLGLRRENDEVFYAPVGAVAWDHRHLTFLKEQAARVPRLRARICAHEGPESTQQQMLILHHQSCYVRPHCHIGKLESITVLEGEAQALLFSPSGVLEQVVNLSASLKPETHFFLQFPPEQIHGLLIRSEWFCFLETTRGPFRREETRFPDWAPPEPKQADFLATLDAQVRRFMTGEE